MHVKSRVGASIEIFHVLQDMLTPLKLQHVRLAILETDVDRDSQPRFTSSSVFSPLTKILDHR